MNDLLFYTLLALLLYYFFYLPQKTSPTLLKPITHSQTTQTETLKEHEPGSEFIPDPEEIKQLRDQNQALLKDQAQIELALNQLIKALTKLSQELC